MKYALMLLQLVPVLIDIMKKLETLFPQVNAGKMKLEMLREILAEVYPDVMVAWNQIESLVSKIVELFNKFGIFTVTPKAQ